MEENNSVIKSPLLMGLPTTSLQTQHLLCLFPAHAFLLFLWCVTLSSTTGLLHMLFFLQHSAIGPPHSTFPLISLRPKLLQRGYPSNMISILKITCFLPTIFIPWFLFNFLFSTYLYLKLCIALFVICLLSDSQ